MKRPVRRLMELRRAYTLDDARDVPMGAVTYDRLATERAIDEWLGAARAASSWYDDQPNVVRTVLPSLGMVRLIVIGWYED